MSKQVLEALTDLESELIHYHAQSSPGEDYHPDYKKNKSIFKMLVRSDLETEKVMTSYFEDLAERIVHSINWPLFEQTVQKGSISDYIDHEWDGELLKMKVLLTDSLIEAIVAGGQYTEDEFNIDIGWNEKNDPAINFLDKHTTWLSRTLNRTTEKRLRSALRQSINMGESIGEATARVMKVVDDPRRAGVIAHTESVRAFSQGRLEAGRQMGADRKEWDTTLNPCPICEPLDGDVVKLDETFEGGFDAPPAHPNCRCLIRLVMPQQ